MERTSFLLFDQLNFWSSINTLDTNRKSLASYLSALIAVLRLLQKGGEVFITRKEKSITKATVDIAFRKALELGEKATGPKKLGVFGASYLYQVFVRFGVIKTQENK